MTKCFGCWPVGKSTCWSGGFFNRKSVSTVSHRPSHLPSLHAQTGASDMLAFKKPFKQTSRLTMNSLFVHKRPISPTHTQRELGFSRTCMSAQTSGRFTSLFCFPTYPTDQTHWVCRPSLYNTSGVSTQSLQVNSPVWASRLLTKKNTNNKHAYRFPNLFCLLPSLSFPLLSLFFCFKVFWVTAHASWGTSTTVYQTVKAKRSGPRTL